MDIKYLFSLVFIDVCSGLRGCVFVDFCSSSQTKYTKNYYELYDTQILPFLSLMCCNLIAALFNWFSCFFNEKRPKRAEFAGLSLP